MTTETLIALLQLVTALSLLLGLIFVILSVSYFRRSRRDAFWRQRRAAGQRGFRYAVGAVLLLGIAAAFCMITLAVTFVEGDKDDELAAAPSPTLTPTPSLTPTSTELATDLPLPTATAVIELTPTILAESAVAPAAQSLSAPEPTSVPTIFTATPQPTEIQTSSRLEIWAIDNRITDDWQPVAPQIAFTGQIQRLYFYINFEQIEAGETVTKSLLRDGEIVSQQIHQWGMTAAQGATFFFFGNAGGFSPGNYEVRVTLGAEAILLSSSEFTIAP